MIMLTFVVVQILACDVFHSDECYVSAQSPDHDNGHNDPSSDSCLCCCAHVTFEHAFVFHPQETVTPAPPPKAERTPLSPPHNIEHPPQLS
jgi:hypothetical protein